MKVKYHSTVPSRRKPANLVDHVVAQLKERNERKLVTSPSPIVLRRMLIPAAALDCVV